MSCTAFTGAWADKRCKASHEVRKSADGRLGREAAPIRHTGQELSEHGKVASLLGKFAGRILVFGLGNRNSSSKRWGLGFDLRSEHSDCRALADRSTHSHFFSPLHRRFAESDSTRLEAAEFMPDGNLRRRCFFFTELDLNKTSFITLAS